MFEAEKLAILFALISKQIISYQYFTVYGRAPYIQQLYFYLLITIFLKEKIVFVCHSPPFLFFPPYSFVLSLCPPLHPTFAYGSRLESNYFFHARDQLWNPQKELTKEKLSLLSAFCSLMPENPEVNVHGQNSQVLRRKQTGILVTQKRQQEKLSIFKDRKALWYQNHYLPGTEKNFQQFVYSSSISIVCI